MRRRSKLSFSLKWQNLQLLFARSLISSEHSYLQNRASGVSSDFLTNGTSDDLAESSLTDKELLNQFKAIEKMPERDKDVVKTLIDAFITKGKLKQLVL